jgi:hypothetical protein
MQLHAACAALPACCLRFLLFGFRGSIKGVGATRKPSRTYGSACGHSSKGGAVLRGETWRAPEAEPRALSKSKSK